MKTKIALTVALAGTFFIGKKLLDKNQEEKITEEKEYNSELRITLDEVNKDLFLCLNILDTIGEKPVSLSKEETIKIIDIGITLRPRIGSKALYKTTFLEKKNMIDKIKDILKGSK
jgi:hypothetical protein